MSVKCICNSVFLHLTQRFWQTVSLNTTCTHATCLWNLSLCVTNHKWWPQLIACNFSGKSKVWGPSIQSINFSVKVCVSKGSTDGCSDSQNSTGGCGHIPDTCLHTIGRYILKELTVKLFCIPCLPSYKHNYVLTQQLPDILVLLYHPVTCI